jgi:hypothetical protein
LFQMNCSVTRRRQDLNRRKVAAIFFLANITVEGESDLPEYRCLMETLVFDSYRRNKCNRELARRGAGRGNV